MASAGLGHGGVGSSTSASGFKGSSSSVDWLGREMLAMKLRDRVDHDDDRDSEPDVTDGVGAETGHVIRTTIGGRSSQAKQLASYIAEHVIGTGSFGVVFQAKCRETGEIVAIKKVLQDKRYKNRELQIMQMLDHPNVVALKQSFFSTSDKEEVYLNLVLEFVPETVNRIAKQYSRMNQRLPLICVKLYTYQLSGGSSMQQNTSSPFKNSISSAVKQSQRREASGKIVRSILVKDNRQNQSSVVRPDQQNQTSSLEKDKRPPRPPSMHLLQKDANVSPDDKVPNDLHSVHSEKQERRTRNKYRPDRVVWTPLRHSDGSHASDESQSAPDSAEGTQFEMRNDMLSARGGGFWHGGSGRGSHSSDNGSYRYGGRRGSTYMTDSDGSSIVEGKPLRRGGSSGFSSHEKQVWVQKSSSGS